MTHVLAAPGDTWGISGPTFLAFYAALIVVVLVAGVRARRGLAEPDRPVADRRDWGERPQDVAFLNGGPELAVYSALSAMHLSGAIATPTRGTVQAAGRLEPRATALERAIHATAATPTGQRRLQYHSAVAAALAATRDRLAVGGLLLTPERRARIRMVGLWMLAVTGLGLVRIVAGVANARGVGFLVVFVLVAAAISVVHLLRAPDRTAAGDRLLAELRTRHYELGPTQRPDWVAYGAGAAALGVGVFGMGALWAADPAFADELEAQKLAAWGGSSGGGYSGGTSSDGGSSSGSSCGGGGGGCGG
jgi:uncharacterized protein (TIGR04222 family)